MRFKVEYGLYIFIYIRGWDKSIIEIYFMAISKLEINNYKPKKYKKLVSHQGIIGRDEWITHKWWMDNQHFMDNLKNVDDNM